MNLCSLNWSDGYASDTFSTDHLTDLIQQGLLSLWPGPFFLHTREPTIATRAVVHWYSGLQANGDQFV